MHFSEVFLLNVLSIVAADDDLSELESTSSTTTTTESVESLISGKKISKGKLVESKTLKICISITTEPFV